MSEVVLDASAVLAVALAEPGAEVVAESSRGGLISAVNVSEAAAVLIGAGVSPATARAKLSGLELVTLAFDEEDALLAAALRALTRAAGLWRWRSAAICRRSPRTGRGPGSTSGSRCGLSVDIAGRRS